MLTPSFNQHVRYKWLCMSAEREIGYIKVGFCQPPSAPTRWNLLCYIWGETDQSSSTPNPWIKAKSYSTEIRSAPGNPLWMWERTAQWVCRGRLGVLGSEREEAGEDFISTALRIRLEKQNHRWVFQTQMTLNGTSDLGYCHPGCCNMLVSSACRWGDSNPSKVTVRWF